MPSRVQITINKLLTCIASHKDTKCVYHASNCGESGLSVEGIVSFKPIGFHDVYYCLLVNEPVISMYEKGNLVCEHCHTELPNENHVFVCHINKHKIKNAEEKK